MSNFQPYTLYNTNTYVHGGGIPGAVDPKGRSGWYFKNQLPQTKIHWYFFDGSSFDISVSDFSAFAIIELDSLVSRPWLGVYTKTTGSGDFYPGFFKSSRNFMWPNGSVVGTKYLIYFGQNPSIYPDLPRVQLINGTTRGSFGSNEKIFTVALSTDSGASVNSVQLVSERLGVISPSVSLDIKLAFPSPSVKAVTAKTLFHGKVKII